MPPVEDFPALAKLTEDVVAAMHAAERREHRRHASRTRRRFGVLTVIAALLIPAGVALHAGSANGATLTLDHHAAAYATAAGAGAATAVVAVAAAKSTPTTSIRQRTLAPR